MRRFVLSLVILVEAGFAGYAQNDSGALQGVYAPPTSAPGKLRGAYTPLQSVPAPAPLPSTVTAPDYSAQRGPNVSLPGSADPGQSLPESVKPSPIPGRPGYGRAMVNGRPAIIDMGDNRIVQYSD
jgi:Protein of unknown function (DUF1236)